ncbi:putative Ig domain-containing protein [Dickeya lacustris]|uniref:Ig domain-containing protein n=1 Tax=Dickeya lacustris TaxID=2259638 RepID=A0ABY8G475_9GAMM|nr:putative Ig domain-containing protein [Dickeya lacustris]WFN54761.1 putative Ig domain-containing protein [Dickeya lacustris]
MLWRKFFKRQARQLTADSVTAAEPFICGYVLEARMLFDGAVAATVEQTTNTAEQTADTHTATKAVATESTQSDSSHATQNDAAHTSDSTDVAASAVTAAHKEVVFIDTSVAGYQTLVANVPAGMDVVLLDGSKDGLTQMAVWAQTHSGYDAIHVLSHGSEGAAQLGTLTLNSTTALARANDLATLGAALNADGDLLLYGCDVAQASGQQFASLLAQLTSADVAASTNPTGASALGGDWVTEFHTGEIGVQDLAITSYTSLLSVSGTSVTVTAPNDPSTEYISLTSVSSGVEFDLDGNNNTADINPTNNTVTITYNPGANLGGSFDLVFQGGNLDHFTGITKTSSSGTNANDVTASVSGKTIHITVNDANGGFSGGTLVFTFTSVDVSTDTAPTVTGSATNPTYTENGSGVSLFSGVSASTHDSGQTFSGAVFTVSNVADTTEYLTINGVGVALTNGNSLSLGSGYGTASVSKSGNTATVTLTGASLSDANMSTLLSGMTYRNSSENPSVTSRTVTLSQLTDSGSSNNTASPGFSSQVTVHAVNDAPTDISLTSGSIGQSLGSNGTVGTLSATDVDSSSFTYTLVSGTGSTNNNLFTITGNTLKVNNAATMTPGAYSVRVQVSDGTDTYQKVFSVTVSDDVRPTFDVAPAASNISGSGFDLSASIDEAGTLYYVIVADGASAPSVSQIIAGQNASGVTAIGSGSQVVSSAPYTTSFSVTGLNGATSYDVYMVAKDSANNQILSATKVDVTTSSNSAPVFSNLNGGATFTEKGSAVVIDSNVAVADTELDALSGGLGNYSGASLTLARNGGANSQDSFGNSGLLGALTAGQSFTYNGTAVGNVTTHSGGTLALTFNGNATSAIVNAVLQSLTYANSSDNPPASVTLNWVFNDGALNSSGTNQAIVSITPVNDTPTISNMSVSKTFNEDSAQTFSASDFGFSDVDSGDTLQAVTIVTAPTAGELFIDANSDGVRGVGDTLISDGATVSASDISKLTFRPAANANGVGYASFTWKVSDGTVLSNDVGTMTLDVTAVNDAPVISATSVSKTFNEDSTQTFSASDFGFSDVDSGNTLQSITIVSAPTAGELFIDANSDGVRGGGDTLISNGSVVSAADIGKLTFRPEANANGASYSNFTWQVSDGTALSANTGTMTLNVTPINDAPTLNNSATATLTGTNENTMSAATAVTLLLSQAGYGDVDSGAQIGLAITSSVGRGGWQYSTDSGANWFNLGSVSASSALLLNSSAQLRYVPDGANGETASLNFRAWDQTSGTATAGASRGLADTATTGGSSAFSTNSALASLAVTDVNDTPTLSNAIGAQSVVKETPFSFTVPSNTFADVDSGDVLTLSATQADGSALPGWLSFNPATRTFSGTPGSSDVGNLSIRVTATDGSNASVSTTFGLAVNNSNQPPVLSTPVADQSVAQNGAFSFTVPANTFTDADSGDVLTLSATQADGSALPGWLSFNPATRTFSGTPGNGDVGNLSIRVTATDGSNASVSTTFALAVSNVNDAPVVSGTLAAQSVAQNGAFSFTVPANTFTDADSGDVLTFSATQADGSALPGWLTFNPATRTFSGTPGSSDVGNLSIRVTATDGSNASVSTTFALAVSNVNDAPVVSGTLAAQAVVQNGAFSFTVPANTFTDADSGDVLTLSATQADGSALPGWLSFNPATRTFSGTPGSSDVGNLSIRVTATDGSNASVSTTFALAVSNVNDAPVVNGTLAAQAVAQNGAFSFTVPANTFTDADSGDVLTLSATQADGSALPGWLSFNPATRTFSGTPGSSDVGNLSIRVTATDSSNASVSTTFALAVSAATVEAPNITQLLQDSSNTLSSVTGTSVTTLPPVGSAGNAAPVALGTLITSSSLGAVDNRAESASTTITSTIFQSPQRTSTAGGAVVSQLASSFAQLTNGAGASLFDSALGSFPSFNTGGALGGSSSLSGLFSGIHLPSLSPMAVFSGGSWRDVNSTSRMTTASLRADDSAQAVAAQFAVGLDVQLQQIGAQEWQRLSVIEQALQEIAAAEPYHDEGSQQQG